MKTAAKQSGRNALGAPKRSLFCAEGESDGQVPHEGQLVRGAMCKSVDLNTEFEERLNRKSSTKPLMRNHPFSSQRSWIVSMNSERPGEDSKSNQFQSVDTPHQSAEAPVYLGELWFFADWFILDCRPKWSCFIMDFLSKDVPTKWCEKTHGELRFHGNSTRQSYHRFFAPPKSNGCPGIVILEICLWGLSFLRGWWLRSWGCWFLIIYRVYIGNINLSWILMWSLSNPWVLGLATNMTHLA